MLIQMPLYQVSWMLVPGGPLHSASKHAILGIIHLPFELQGIHIGIIHPFFCGMKFQISICTLFIDTLEWAAYTSSNLQ